MALSELFLLVNFSLGQASQPRAGDIFRVEKKLGERGGSLATNE